MQRKGGRVGHVKIDGGFRDVDTGSPYTGAFNGTAHRHTLQPLEKSQQEARERFQTT